MSVPVLLLLAVVFMAASALFFEGWREPGSKVNLASALVGAAVALVVLGLQSATEEQRQEIEQQQQQVAVQQQRIANEAEELQRRIADRQNLQVTIGLQRDLSGIDLADRNLEGFYLRGKRLQFARLSRANLKGASLANADLSGADLNGADLRGASLRGANLQGAKLKKAIFGDADLTSANFKRADLREAAVLHGTNFTRLDSTTLSWCSCTSMELTSTVVTLETPRSRKQPMSRSRAIRYPVAGELDPNAGSAEPSDLGCHLAGVLKSREDRVATDINFTNETSRSVHLYWLNYEGSKESYGTLDPGQSQEFETYLTHPWLITDESGSCISVFFPSKKFKDVPIND